MIQIFVQFHCLSSYRNDLYRNDRFPFRPLQRFSSDWNDQDGQVDCTEIRIHTSGGPIIEYMRKKWKYCCKWRPCSGTSFFNRPSTAVKIWSLSVALLSSSAKQTNKESITTNSREILSKNKKPFKQNFALSHQSVLSMFGETQTTAQVCVSLATNVQAQAAVPNCIDMSKRWYLQTKPKCKLWALLIFGFKEYAQQREEKEMSWWWPIFVNCAYQPASYQPCYQGSLFFFVRETLIKKLRP